MHSKLVMTLSIVASVAILVAPSAQGSSNPLTVKASDIDRTISFEISSTGDVPPVYGFIITLYDRQHYSKIFSPLGWSAGVIQYRSAMWVTKTDPVEPGSVQDGFAIKVAKAGEYRIVWSVMDKTMRPIYSGSVSVNVQ
jgi:hypothetical protein